MTTLDGERVALTAFVTYAVLAGGNAVGIRFSNRELGTLWGPPSHTSSGEGED